MARQMKNQIPDTLNLADRAHLVLNAMIGVADEDKDYIPFIKGYFASDPVWMNHINWDYGSSHSRLIDSMTLVRAMTGAKEGSEIEKYYKKNFLTFFQEDGLNYCKNTLAENHVKASDARFEDSASMTDQRAVLLGLTTWFMDTGDLMVKDRADKHVAALKRLVRKERNSWFNPATEFTEHDWQSFDGVMTSLCPDPCAMWGRQIFPLIRYYQHTGNEDAFELSVNFVANIVYRSGAFGENGSWNSDHGFKNGHFHTRMSTLASIARFSEFTHDAFLMNWVKKCFDWGLSKCTSFGWTPGDLEDEHETCTLVEAIGTCITLARNGYTEYWSKAEKFLRNQLTQVRLTNISGCVASGARGLYNGWNNIVTEESGTVSINLLFNKASKWLNLYSYLPHEGKLIIDVKEGINTLCIRIPESVAYESVKVKRMVDCEVQEMNGRDLPWVNTCYAKLNQVREGEEIEVTFSVITKTTVEKAADEEFVAKWAGETVVDITPKGIYYPLYKKIKLEVKTPVKKGTLYLGSNVDFD